MPRQAPRPLNLPTTRAAAQPIDTFINDQRGTRTSQTANQLTGIATNALAEETRKQEIEEARFEKLKGQDRARQTILDYEGKVAEGEIDPLDIDLEDYFGSIAEKAGEEFGEESIALEGFNQILGNYEFSAERSQAQQIGELRRNELKEAFTRTAFMTLRDQDNNYGEISRKIQLEFPGLTPKETDDLLFNVAETFAIEGNVKAASGILNYKRTNENGQNIGSIREKPAFSTRASRILEAAKAEEAKITEEQQLEYFLKADEVVRAGGNITDFVRRGVAAKVITAEQGTSLVRQAREQAQRDANGYVDQAIDIQNRTQAVSIVNEAIQAKRLWELSDENISYKDRNGNDKTFPLSPVIDEMIDLKLEQISQQSSAEGLSPNQTTALQAKFLSDQGLDTYEPWAKEIGAGYVSATPSNLANAESVSQTTEQAIERLRIVKATSPAIYENLMGSGDQRDFFEAALTLTEAGAMDNRQAAFQASSGIARKRDGVVPQVSYKEARTAARKAFGSDLGGKFGFNSNVVIEEAARRIQTISDLTGVPTDVVSKKVHNDLKSRSVEVDDSFVPLDPKLMASPKLAKQIFTDLRNDLAERYGVQKDSIGFMYRNGLYIVTHDGYALSLDNTAPYLTISPSDMLNRADQEQDIAIENGRIKLAKREEYYKNQGALQNSVDLDDFVISPAGGMIRPYE